jgi:hypothetical protein
MDEEAQRTRRKRQKRQPSNVKFATIDPYERYNMDKQLERKKDEEYWIVS